jgi:hypothetical protein
MIPSWLPSAPITRTGLIRICRLTRGGRFVESWIVRTPVEETENADP